MNYFINCSAIWDQLWVGQIVQKDDTLWRISEPFCYKSPNKFSKSGAMYKMMQTKECVLLLIGFTHTRCSVVAANVE